MVEIFLCILYSLMKLVSIREFQITSILKFPSDLADMKQQKLSKKRRN
jgi:hypothetical protein